MYVHVGDWCTCWCLVYMLVFGLHVGVWSTCWCLVYMLVIDVRTCWCLVYMLVFGVCIYTDIICTYVCTNVGGRFRSVCVPHLWKEDTKVLQDQSGRLDAGEFTFMCVRSLQQMPQLLGRILVFLWVLDEGASSKSFCITDHELLIDTDLPCCEFLLVVPLLSYRRLKFAFNLEGCFHQSRLWRGIVKFATWKSWSMLHYRDLCKKMF